MKRRDRRMPATVAKWTFLVFVSVWLCLPEAANAQRPRFSVSAPIEVEAGDDLLPQALALGDLNKDARPDIVVITDDADGPIAVLINQGDGTFSTPRVIVDEDAVIGEPIAVAVADFGSASGGPDTNNDIVVIDADGGFIVVFGDGAGNFVVEGELTELDGLDFPVGVAVANFDGQNGPDLAIADEESSDDNGQVFFFCNVGTAALLEPCGTVSLSSGGEEPIDIAAGDFNGDGSADVVVLNRGGAVGEGNVGVFVGSGDGMFEAGRPFPVAHEPRDLAVGSLNPAIDSIDDVVVAEFEVLGDDNVTILLGGTTGAVFTRPAKALLEIGTTALAIGDLGGDTNPDIGGGNDPDQTSSIIAVTTGNGLGDFADPQQGGSLSGGAVSLVSGRLNADELDDLVALNLDGTQLRIAINNPIGPTDTPTSTTTSTQPATRTATPTPSASVTATNQPTSTPVTTNTPTPRSADEDDACAIVSNGTRARGDSWLLFLFATVGIWFRRRHRSVGRAPKP